MIEQLYEANYSHLEFIEAMNGGDCDCTIHEQIKELQKAEEICLICSSDKDSNGLIICTFCNDNSKSCGACDDGYEGE